MDPSDTIEVIQQQPPSCARCRGDMVTGWIRDQVHDHSLSQHWIPGSVRLGLSGHPKLPPADERFAVVTYRCVLCGYLESYARPGVQTE